MIHNPDKFIAAAAATKGPAPYAKRASQPACGNLAHQLAKRQQLVTEIAHQRDYGNIPGACWLEAQLEICERAIKRIEAVRAADMPRLAAAE
ncbi:MAG TPA: hypothetical protein VH020_09290 [Stellaceae bacterium]|jgi:hypothetical protein|nr:hypothetical protein [Stellaceae bacterium]